MGLSTGDGTARVWSGVRVTNAVGVRAIIGNPVSDPGVITVDAIDHGKRIAALVCHDAGKLPSAEESVGESFAGEVRLFVHPGHGQNVALIIIGAGVVAVYVIGVYEVPVQIVRRIIQGVTVRVGYVEGKWTVGLAQRKLQGVIIRVSFRFHALE